MKKFNGLDCILLVDDDFLTNYIHTLAIKRTLIDAHIKDIDNVTEALDFLTKKGKYEDKTDCLRPGIIFLDINMPGLNGWDFMDRYKEIDDTIKAKVIVVMLTNSLNDDDRARAELDNQIVLFLPKPLRPQTVIDIAEQYFNHQKE